MGAPTDPPKLLNRSRCRNSGRGPGRESPGRRVQGGGKTPPGRRGPGESRSLPGRLHARKHGAGFQGRHTPLVAGPAAITLVWEGSWGGAGTPRSKRDETAHVSIGGPGLDAQVAPRAGGDATGNAQRVPLAKVGVVLPRTPCVGRYRHLQGCYGSPALTYRRAMLVLPREAPWSSDRTTCGAANKHRRAGLWAVFRQSSHNTGQAALTRHLIRQALSAAHDHVQLIV